jgi:exodeoxyribonuclease VII small subunit
MATKESFEELMNKLKTTLDTLEKGDLSLEHSMKSYEEGVILVRHLEEKLKKMEGRMEEILADGTIKDLVVEVSENEAV